MLFSRKNQIQNHPTISLNNIQVERTNFQKHLGLILDEKLNFKQHVDSALSKVNKGISVMKKLRHTLPWKSLITIYKVFLRPLIDYGDIIYDQPNNDSFCEKLESIQYKAALAITGAIQRVHTTKERSNIFDPKGLKLLTRLRLEFSHLNEHRFRHNFEECVNPLCSCS